MSFGQDFIDNLRLAHSGHKERGCAGSACAASFRSSILPGGAINHPAW